MSEDYVIGVTDTLSSVDATAWDALLYTQPNPSPFMRHAYLTALIDSGSACARTGWRPHCFTVHQGKALVAACVVFEKSHSYGEYVFDWAWANAYAQHGLAYYPKALVAVPFTPVPGTRLLARDAAARQALVQALLGWCREQALSSLHILFASDEDLAVCDEAGLLRRYTAQFHWKNESPPFATFEAFLASLNQDKRKSIYHDMGMMVRDEGGTIVPFFNQFIDAVAGVMRRRMETDPRVVVLGEDVHRLSGGTNGATKGLKDAFPDRVLGTPIAENAFTGLGGGMALDGRFRPVVEFMYADFMWVAADQLFNQIAKARHMFGGTGAVPLVLRTKIAMGTGYGSQHSMDPAGVYVTSAGFRIVAPSTPYDYVGLMNTALALDDPVVVLEHVDLYASTGPGLPDDYDHYLPVGRARVRRSGSRITVLTYGVMVNHVLEAVEQLSVDADVVDLRWLDRASLDWDTITASVQRTNEVVIVEQGARGTSYGSWLGDEVARRLFDWLDAPVHRVHGGEASPTISKVLERASFARTEEVVAALQKIVGE